MGIPVIECQWLDNFLLLGIHISSAIRTNVAFQVNCNNHSDVGVALDRMDFLVKRHALHESKVLVYPFDGFTGRWSDAQRAEYARLLPLYDKAVCVAQRASREAYLKRDRHLVDSSAHCIAYCTRNSGGTAYTVRYAYQQGVSVYNTVSME